MPNWTENRIKINCLGDLPSDVVAERTKAIIDFMTNNEGQVDFEKIIPMPAGIFRGNLSMEDRQKHKDNNWYDWSLQHWGTKWNACDSYIESDYVEFLTAWSDVAPILRALSVRYPDATFDYEYSFEHEGYERLYEDTWFNGELIEQRECKNPNYKDYLVD